MSIPARLRRAQRGLLSEYPKIGPLICKRPLANALIMRLSMAMSLGLTGCALVPEGTPEERAKLDANSAVFEPQVETRQLPELPAQADWRAVLHRAFLANGDLESAYFEWKAALARVYQAATWPNSNVAVSFSYMFSPEQMKFWDRTTIGVGFDVRQSVATDQSADRWGDCSRGGKAGG